MTGSTVLAGPGPGSIFRVSFLFLLAIGAGLVVAIWPVPSALIATSGLIIAVGAVLVVRTWGQRPTPAGLLLTALIPVLVVLPWLTTVVEASNVLRYALAVAVLASLAAQPGKVALTWARRLLIVFMVYQLVVVLVSTDDLEYGLIRASNWIMFMPLAFLRYDRSLLRAIYVGVLVAFLILVAGVLLQLAGALPGAWGGSVLGGFADDPASLVRARRYTSFIGNPNDLALVALGSSIVFIAAIRPGMSSALRWAMIGLAAAGMVVVTLTLSRAALLALPLVVGYLSVTGFRKAAGGVLLLGLGGILGGLLLSVAFGLSSPDVFGSLAALTSGSDVSALARESLWQSRLSGAEGWLFGSGYGGYADTQLPGIGASSERRELYRALTVDNGWLKLALEEGLVGLLLLVGVLLTAIRSAFAAPRNSATGAIARLAALVVCLIAWRALSADAFDVNPWNAVLWIAVGVATGVTGSTPGDGLPDEAVRP